MPQIYFKKNGDTIWYDCRRFGGMDSSQTIPMLGHMALVLAWALFGALHSMLASPGVKARAERWWGKNYRYYRPAYSVFATLTLCLVLWFQFSLSSPLMWQTPAPLQGMLWVLGLAGLVIMGWCIRKYFFHLSGIDVFFRKKEQSFLVTNGLHRYVRHPLYAGTLLATWSACLLFPQLSHLLAGVTITVYTLVGIRLEEKKLETAFGESYKKYKRNVPMIIPFTKFGDISQSVSDKLH